MTLVPAQTSSTRCCGLDVDRRQKAVAQVIEKTEGRKNIGAVVILCDVGKNGVDIVGPDRLEGLFAGQFL